MFNVEFYRDKKGEEPVKDFLMELQRRRDSDKRMRVLSDKILVYLRVLQEYGTRAGMPYMKHLEGDLWEMRPLHERILFFAYIDGRFVFCTIFARKHRRPLRKRLNVRNVGWRTIWKGRESNGDEFQ